MLSVNENKLMGTLPESWSNLTNVSQCHLSVNMLVDHKAKAATFVYANAYLFISFVVCHANCMLKSIANAAVCSEFECKFTAGDCTRVMKNTHQNKLTPCVHLALQSK